LGDNGNRLTFAKVVQEGARAASLDTGRDADLGDDAGGAVLEPDGGLAFVPVLPAGAGRLERAHLALPHQLLVAHPQVVDQLLAVLRLLPLAASAGAV
jgi:hypothetical protein